MKINKNDPRLTAYMLNELSVDESREIEKALQESAELRSEVEALKKSLNSLQKSAKTSDEKFRLTHSQRNKIFAQISSDQPSLYQRFSKSTWGYATAGLMTAGFALMMFNHTLKHEAQPIQDQARVESDMANESAALEQDASLPPTPPAALPEPKKNFASAKEGSSTGINKMKETYGGGSGSNLGAKSDLDGEAKKTRSAVVAAKPSAPQALGVGAKGALSLAASESAAPVAIRSRSAKDASTPKYVLEITPTLKPALYKQVESEIKNCIEDFSTRQFAFTWTQTLNEFDEIEPKEALTLDQQVCLKNAFPKVIWPKSNSFHFKLKNVSK